FASFPTTPAGFAALPDVSLVIPSLIHDMHNGTSIPAEVTAGDAWLRKNLDAYARWAVTHNSLLIVTWDEDSSSYTIVCANGVITTTPPNNRIATVIVGQPVKVGAHSTITYTHHDLLRTLLDIYGIAPFAGAVGAKDITDIWQ
ncbi:MAG TPA: alkaline phosphatase family protein, partial [Thermoanaerobaculia bacterium]|nr:alkaline phosphatase family protein [Thermoanaerobaculia bacterium]